MELALNSAQLASEVPAPLVRLTAPLEQTRSLHLVDVENLMGGTAFDEAAVTEVAAIYAEIAGLGGCDHVVLASSHHTAYPAWMGWGRAGRRLVRSGQDGADHALLEVIETENVAERYDRIVIGSGDGIFALPVAKLQALGAGVTIVCRPQSLSHQIRLAARDIRYLDVAPPLQPLADVLRIA